MKRIIYILSFIFCSSALFSCQKVIKVDLNSTDPRIVIDANITDEPGPYFVKLTKTINFDQSNVFPPVTGATVTVSDDAGNTETLTEATPGIYQTSTTTGVAGRTYTLSVTASGKTYTSTSKLYPAIPVDSLGIQKSFFGTTRNIRAYFTDPAGIKNWYRLVQIVNDSAGKDIYITNDILRDGRQMDEILFMDNDNVEDSLQAGDSVTIALQAIDEGAYNYFRTLQTITQGGDPGSTPANPQSNMSNGALGYFSTYSVRRRSIIIR